MDVEIGDRRDLAPRESSGVAHQRPRQPSAHRFAGGMEAEAQAYLGILRRRAALIRAVFLVVVALALGYTVLQDDIYRAGALVQIRGSDSQIPSVDRLFSHGEPTPEDLQTHLGLLRSESVADKVIDDLALDTVDEFNPEGDAFRQEIVAGFLDRLVVDPVEESRLVRVTFEAASPSLSADIVNGILDAYADLSVQNRQGTAKRLALQVDSVEDRLEASERELREYAEENDLPYSPEEDLTAQLGRRLSDLRQRLAEAEAVRMERESRYDVVVQDGRAELVDDALKQELELRLSELRRDHARLSATFTEDYPETADLRRQIEQVRRLIEEEEGRIARGVESDYRLALQREGKLSEAIADMQRRANELGPQSGAYHVLRQAVLANRTLYASLHQKQREAEIAAAIGSTGLEVVDRAAAPTDAYRPAFAMTLGLALMLGLVLGVGSAFTRELFDDTVQAADDVQASSPVPVLAMIPSVGEESEAQIPLHPRRASGVLPWPAYQRAVRRREGRRPAWPRIDADGEPAPGARALADAIGALRASVLFHDSEKETPRSILVSSCRAGEGKTTVSLNLAMSLTRLGHRVLLVDADLRRPAVHRALGLRAGPGLGDYLAGEVAWQASRQRSAVEGMDVLTSGGATTRAGDLLSDAALQRFLREVEERYDFVIVDAPALFINAADARLLSRPVDGVIVVVRSQSTPRSLIDRIPRAVPNLLGVVVNDLRQAALPDYFGDYFAGYGEEGPDERREPRGAGDDPPSGIAAAFQRLTNWIYSEA